MPGLALGAFTGNRLGAVRDAKGKSVAAVFNELASHQKAEVSQMHEVCLSLMSQLTLLLSTDFTRFGNESSGFCIVVLDS